MSKRATTISFFLGPVFRPARPYGVLDERITTQEEWRRAWGLICQIQDRSAAEREAILPASAAPESVLEHVREALASSGVGSMGPSIWPAGKTAPAHCRLEIDSLWTAHTCESEEW